MTSPAPSHHTVCWLHQRATLQLCTKRMRWEWGGGEWEGWWEDCIEVTKHVTFSCPSQMTRPPPVVLPEVRPIEVKEEMTFQRTILVRGGGRVGNSTWRVTSSTLPPSTCTYAWPPSAAKGDPCPEALEEKHGGQKATTEGHLQ